MILSHLASTVFDANFFLRVYTGYFWPLRAVWEALKTPPEVPVEDETCKTINGTYFKGISSQKNWTGLAGGVRNQFWGQSLKMTKSEKI